MIFERAGLQRLLSFFMLGTMMFAGCSAPPAKKPVVRFEPDGSLQRYRKVHILALPGDYRHMQVKLLTRLRGLGFEADIIDREKGLGRSQGTAFVVSREGHLLTCAHVLGQNEKATVWLAGGRYEALVVRTDAGSDLALLELDAVTIPPLVPIPFSPNTNHTLGQDVFTMGFPLSDILGGAPRLTKGLVSATVGLNDDPRHLQVSAEVQPGNSGGPLLNDRGEFIGVVSDFHDLKTGKRLLRTGLLQGERDNTEDAVLNRAIEEIRKNFFTLPPSSKKNG